MRTREIPSLDGLRAISVGLVVFSHLRYLPGTQALDWAGPLGLFGVRVFFVLSGFLITGLLVRELEREGTIQLGRFYLRRTLRIFPAYYAMLVVSAWLGHVHVLDATGAQWARLISYTSNIGSQPLALGHTWSLSVEEQFYLLWPLTMLILGRERSLRIAVGILFGMPFVRLGWFALFHDGALTFTLPIDFLAAGCVMALAEERLGRSTRWQRLISSRWPALLFPLCAAYQVPFALSHRWRFAFDIAFGQTLTALTLTVVVAWSIATPDSGICRWLNTKPMRAIGVASYSIYLWQQSAFAFTPPLTWPVTFVTISVLATLSYFLIEQPALEFRQLLEARGRLVSTANSHATS